MEHSSRMEMEPQDFEESYESYEDGNGGDQSMPMSGVSYSSTGQSPNSSPEQAEFVAAAGVTSGTVFRRRKSKKDERRFIQPRAAFDRTYKSLGGIRTNEIVQRMVNQGKVLWVGQELKWVGTSDYRDEEEEEEDRFGYGLGDGNNNVLADFYPDSSSSSNEGGEIGGDLEELNEYRKSRGRVVRAKRRDVHFGQGFMVEPGESPGKKIRRVRRKLKEAFDQDEEDITLWEEVTGTDERAVAARKRMHQEWFQRQLRKVDPSSIVPVSVSGSNGSSASSEGETDQELGVTDEEDEAELISGTIEGWILPQQTISSRTPSPTVIGEPEYELEEPEFIINEPVPEEPPAKKRKQKHEPQPHTDGKIYPKPAFSYSCLIAMALKNSKSGCLPVSEIYKFMCDHFPYFKSAPSGWKNSVRHNLSLNKCFEKIEKPGTGTRKGCLWALNPAKVTKMDEEVQKWSRKDPMAIRRAMSDPENLEIIEKGELKRDYSGNAGSDEDEEEDFSEPHTPITPVRLQARGSRASSSDSLISMGDSRVSSTTQSNIAQIRSNLLRPDHKIHLKDDTLDFGTITNVQGNYLCHANSGTNTYTLSFSSLHNSPTPLIIRRTPVK